MYLPDDTVWWLFIDNGEAGFSPADTDLSVGLDENCMGIYRWDSFILICLIFNFRQVVHFET